MAADAEEGDRFEAARELRLADRLVQPALLRVVGPDGARHQLEPKY